MTEKIIEINGKITAIDMVKKNVTIRGEDNAPHGFSWDTEPLDVYFKKQMVGYYQSFKYDPDTYLLKGAHYWQEGKEVMAKLPQPEGKFPPRKPRVTIGFKIAVAQYENISIEVEGKDTQECKALLGEALDSLAPNHPPTKDLIQSFKKRLL